MEYRVGRDGDIHYTLDSARTEAEYEMVCAYPHGPANGHRWQYTIYRRKDEFSKWEPYEQIKRVRVIKKIRRTC